MEFVAGIVIILALLALIPAKIAESKGREGAIWWIYGFFFFIIEVIHAAFLRDTVNVTDQKAAAAGNLKCPHCAEWIKREAKVCRHCGRDVEPAGKLTMQAI